MQYLGYKSHVSLNAETGLITTIAPSAGSAADNEQFPTLLAHDEAVGVAAEVYAGDRAYDDTDQHYRLWAAGKDFRRCDSTITARGPATPTKPSGRRWPDSAEYQVGKGERYKVERKFGEAKRWHGFGRCRYLGLLRYGTQAYRWPWLDPSGS